MGQFTFTVNVDNNEYNILYGYKMVTENEYHFDIKSKNDISNNKFNITVDTNPNDSTMCHYCTDKTYEGTQGTLLNYFLLSLCDKYKSVSTLDAFYKISGLNQQDLKNGNITDDFSTGNLMIPRIDLKSKIKALNIKSSTIQKLYIKSNSPYIDEPTSTEPFIVSKIKLIVHGTEYYFNNVSCFYYSLNGSTPGGPYILSTEDLSRKTCYADEQFENEINHPVLNFDKTGYQTSDCGMYAMQDSGDHAGEYWGVSNDIQVISSLPIDLIADDGYYEFGFGRPEEQQYDNQLKIGCPVITDFTGEKTVSDEYVTWNVELSEYYTNKKLQIDSEPKICQNYSSKIYELMYSGDTNEIVQRLTRDNKCVCYLIKKNNSFKILYRKISNIILALKYSEDGCCDRSLINNSLDFQFNIV